MGPLLVGDEERGACALLLHLNIFDSYYKQIARNITLQYTYLPLTLAEGEPSSAGRLSTPFQTHSSRILHKLNTPPLLPRLWPIRWNSTYWSTTRTAPLSFCPQRGLWSKTSPSILFRWYGAWWFLSLRSSARCLSLRLRTKREIVQLPHRLFCWSVKAICSAVWICRTGWTCWVFIFYGSSLPGK